MKSNGSQKFTDWRDVISSEYHEIIEKGLTYDKLDELSESENKEVLEQITKALNLCEESAVDELFNLLNDVMSKESKREHWQRNHSAIMKEVHNTFIDENRMPTKTELASITGLSRQTVHKHLSKVSDDSFYREEIDQYKALVPKVLMFLYRNGVAGDTSSFKLFLEMVGERKSLLHQTNYIQINNVLITEENLKKLTREKLDQIKNWINEVERVELKESN